MTTTHPNLTFTVTPPGASAIDYTSKLAWSGAVGSPSINQQFGRQGDTASFVLVDDWQSQPTPTFYIPAMSRVNLRDNGIGQVLFNGVCHDPQMTVPGPNRNEWTLNCTDNTFYADNAIVHGAFYGNTVDEIVVALTALADCGITAAKVSQGGFVSPGPQLASFILNYCTLSEAWRKLAQLAGQVTPYGWYVDENLALHFYDATTADISGVTFTTTPTTSGEGSTTEGHFTQDSFNYEWDGTSLRNRILVQGATQTIYHTTAPTGVPTDTWRADGTQVSWPLRFTVTGSPILYVGGILTAVELVSAGSASEAPWQVAQNNAGGWFLTTTGNPPGNGVILKLWYDYQVPIVAQANDLQSQATYDGPNDGLFVEFISDSSLTTVPMALARAQRERQEYAFAAERISFNTAEEFFGWIRAGQICTIVNKFVPDVDNSGAWGVNDTFIVISNSIQFGQGGYRTMSITAVRVHGAPASGWGSGTYGSGGWGG